MVAMTIREIIEMFMTSYSLEIDVIVLLSLRAV